MNLGIGFGAERIGLAVLRWPRLSLVLILGFLAAVGITLPQLRFDDDIHRVFLSDSPLSDAQRAYEAQQDPPATTVAILVQAPAPLTAAQLTLLRDATLDLELEDGVAGVASPFVLRMPPDGATTPGTPVFGAKIPADYARSLAAFDALDTGLPRFIDRDLTTLMIDVTLDLDRTSLGRALPLMDAAMGPARAQGLTVTLTGEDVISHEIVAGLKDDLLRLNLWGGLIIAVAAFGLLRDLRMAALAVVPGLCAAASTLALSVWLGYPITVISNVIPILLLVLAVADGVHLTAHLKTSDNDIDDTLRRIGPACALTALTTAAAFASVMITANEQLFEFAVLGALGACLAFCVTIGVFTLLARVLRLPGSRPTPVARRLADRLVAVGVDRSGPVILLSLGLLGVGTWGYLTTKPWFPLYQNLPTGSATVAANDVISERFGGVFRMIVEVDGDWQKTRALTRDLSGIAGPGAVLSEANVARWLGQPDVQPDEADLAPLPADLIAQLRPAPGVQRIFVLTPEPMRSDATLARFDRLEQAARKGGADRILGLPVVMRQEAVALIGQLSRGLLIASVGATLLVALAFRSARLIPILFLPNILPIMVTGASLHIWADGELTPTAVLALTIAFGIAIDDSVHFVSRFTAARTAGQDRAEAIADATRSAGQVMVLTTLLLTVGLCITLTSGFAPIRLFGGMMIVTLWAALIVDLVLLPALLSRKDRYA